MNTQQRKHYLRKQQQKKQQPKKLHNTKGEVKYLVVHNSCSRPSMQVKEMDQLPYHFLVTRSGRLISLRAISPADTSIEIAWLGGLDKLGRHVDNRTEEQKETLFNTLLVLTERFGEAQIVAADERYVYGYSNPGFDLKKWLAEYIPAFLDAA